MAAGLGICVDEERGDLDEVLRLRAEIARLREERKPVAWCVQAAARAMVHAGTHIPVSEPVLIQCTDEADARMLSAVYGHRVLVIVEADTKEVPRE
jgi:hypothetical protein